MREADRNPYDEAADEVVAAGNRILDTDEQADSWDVASGLLAGAVQFWLYSRQPCDNPMCEVREHAEGSDYYDAPNDMNFGTA
jgi:hypothetical protein